VLKPAPDTSTTPRSPHSRSHARSVLAPASTCPPAPRSVTSHARSATLLQCYAGMCVSVHRYARSLCNVHSVTHTSPRPAGGSNDSSAAAASESGGGRRAGGQPGCAAGAGAPHAGRRAGAMKPVAQPTALARSTRSTPSISWTTSGYDCPRTPVRGQLQAAAEEQTKLVSLARAEGAVRRAGPGRAGGRAGTAPTRIPTVWACPALPPPAAASQAAWARAAWAPQLPGPAVPCARG